MEGFWGIIKSEMYYLNRFHTYEDLKQAVDNYMEFYNRRRLQIKLEGLSPMEFRTQALAS
jgi:transposase InsO family protein